MIHKEGINIIVIFSIALIIINFLIYYFFSTSSIAFKIFLILSIVFILLILNFFRNPERIPEINDNNILAPADGKIVVIKETEEPEYFKDKRLQISIFMSAYDVHINWVPVSGHIKYFKYHPGDHIVAWHPKSSTKNERTTVVIKKEDNTEILVRQIAGILARRIVCYAKENKDVKQGSQLGFIKFGSRVDIFLPIGTKVNVTIDQKVKGNKTVIATFR